MGTRMPVKTRSTTGPVDLAVRFNRGDHGAHARRRENSRHGRSDGKVDEEERAMRLQLRNLTKGFDIEIGFATHDNKIWHQCTITYIDADVIKAARSEEHTSELQSLMRTSYAV